MDDSSHFFQVAFSFRFRHVICWCRPTTAALNSSPCPCACACRESLRHPSALLLQCEHCQDCECTEVREL